MPPDDPGAEAPDSRSEQELPRWARKPAATGGGPLTEDRLAAYIGPKWEPVYKRKLRPFLEDPSFVPTWNWSAALANVFFPSGWFLYRKLYLPFAIFFLTPGIALYFFTGGQRLASVSEALKPENEWLVAMTAAVQLSASIAAGGTANWFLFRRARAASVFVTTQELGGQDELELMRRLGGVNRTGTVLFVVLTLMLQSFALGA